MQAMRLPRPSVNDTEEDLLQMQQEMFKRRCEEQDPVNNSSFAKEIRQTDKLVGRFSLDLDSVAEEEASVMQLTVQERNIEFLHDTQLNDYTNLSKCENYAEEEGFPDVLDLSKYYNSLDESVKNIPANGKSFFAIEFDRIHGRINDYERNGASTSTVAKSVNDINEEIELENLQRIEKMSKQEIEKAKQEIVERFDPKLLDFLRNKGKKEQQRRTKQIERIPGPQQIEKSTDTTNDVTSGTCANTNPEVTDRIKHLEIFGLEKNDPTFHKDLASELDVYVRLAADAAQMDMATKCMRTILPRQQQNIIRLFDNLRIPPKDYAGDDHLLEMARTNLNAIKGLYLEQRNDKDGNLSVHFAEDIDPFSKGAWMLSPIRKVLDVIQKDGKSTAHDLVIVRLSLFWTLLIMVERPTFYYAFATPGEIFVRLAEIFIMGPEIFKDECVSQCLSRFLHDYLEPKARDGLLCLALKEPVAGLDAFGPFYEDLLHHFEEFSIGDENFTLFILLGAYTNQRLLDGLLMKCAIWTTDRNIVRQMVLKKNSGDFLLNMIAHRMNDGGTTESTYLTQFEKLLLIYAAAIRNGIVVKNRNELVYEIASSELKYYIQWHMTRNAHEKIDMKIMKQYDTLALTLRQSLAGYLEFS
ncbi:unnamed protein product [Cercopithifilaria johnstoni]|uniref:RNA polymerase II-associated protein 1 N-terminal domain-containing protein n=1 Tax=Cercopithifilaria johnstoni TaxID=2874296 RepID=A0A8J2MRT8_9BILA|nr:unnamed protein product [Cercopithifilaria johnstoni]